MTNDTDTLNGALIQLGETLANNLTSMGVADANALDGLTTLAGKILDIEPSVNGLNVEESIVITSSDNTCLKGQSITFYAELSVLYDDETVSDVDLSGVLTGATVNFKIGNTVIGTGVTDSNGIAYYTHTFDDFGQYTISASFEGTDNFDSCVSSNITVNVDYDLVITSDKSILSYKDSDVATITAELSNSNGVVSGETLSYEILDKDDNILNSGSNSTDNNGEISFTYTSTGVGNIQIIVYYGMSLIQTFSIEDNIYWNPLNVSCSEFNTGIISGGYFRSGHSSASKLEAHLLNPIALPSNFEISCDILKTDTYYPWVMLITGESTDDTCKVWNIGKASVSNTTIRRGTDGCPNPSETYFSDNMTTNQSYSMVYKYEKNIHYLSVNGKSVTNSDNTISSNYFFGILFGRNGRIKNLKIKPL